MFYLCFEESERILEGDVTILYTDNTHAFILLTGKLFQILKWSRFGFYSVKGVSLGNL